MAMTFRAEVLVDGEAEGEVLRLRAPIGFWGGVDPETGRIIQPAHPDFGAHLRGYVVALPATVGSSSSSSILLELLRRGVAPAGLILAEADAILALGAVVAEELGIAGLPVLKMPLGGLETGLRARIVAGGNVTVSS